jgi:hypothetical protein
MRHVEVDDLSRRSQSITPAPAAADDRPRRRSTDR